MPMPTNYKYYLIPVLFFLFILTLGSGKKKRFGGSGRIGGGNQPPPHNQPPPQKPPSKSRGSPLVKPPSKSRGSPLVKLVQPGVEEYEPNEPDGPDRVPDPPGSETSRWGTFDLGIVHAPPGSKQNRDFMVKYNL